MRDLARAGELDRRGWSRDGEEVGDEKKECGVCVAVSMERML